MNENWSIQLLIGDGDVANYNQFELVKNQGGNTRYELTQDTGSISGQNPIVLEHISDDNAPVPARQVEQNKQGNFQISIRDATNSPAEWDTILENVHILNRHISGADSTAARHSTDGTAQRVRVAITPDGATLTTYFDVLHGFVDVSRAYYNADSQQGTDSSFPIGALFIPIQLTFKPGGYGDAITLKNDLASSPHFIEDSDSDGLADGWNESGTPTTSLVTSTWLIGGKSQSVNCGAAADGVYSDNVSATSSIAACVWARIGSGTVVIKSRNVTDGTNITSFSVTAAQLAANADASRTSANGDIWYRLDLSGTFTGTKNVRIETAATGGAALYFLDGAYIEAGGTTLPAGTSWCSTTALKNRYDPTVAEDNINYLDVWGIPGDLPAYVETTISDLGGGSYFRWMFIGKREESEVIPSILYHWFDSADATGWTATADANASRGTYERATSDADSLNFVFPPAQVPYITRKPFRLYAIMRTSTTSNSVTISAYPAESGGVAIRTSESITPSVTATWSLVDAGLFNLVGSFPPASVTTSSELRLTALTSFSSGTIDIDALIIIPIDEFSVSGDLDDATTRIISKDGNGVFGLVGAHYERVKSLGTLWNCKSKIMTRYVYTMSGDYTLVSGDDETYELDTEFSISLTVTPRTSHLLGAA